MKLLDLHLGHPLTRGGLTVFPIWNGAAVSSRGYDLRTSKVSVAERTGQPVVHELVVTNAGPRPALIVEGELLEGGLQHRVAARSALVGAGSSLVLDVHCVEEGRWVGNPGHQRRGQRAPTAVRGAHGQGGVWEQVRRYEQRFGPTQTRSLLDATARTRPAAAGLVRELRPLPFQSGVLIGVGGQPLLLEAYDSPRTLSDAWGHLLQAAAVDALHAPTVATPGRRARRFLERLTTAPLMPLAGDLGINVRGVSPYARVSALLWQDRAVHAVATNPRHELLAA